MANFGSLFGLASSGSSAPSENSRSSQSIELLRYHLLERGVYLLRAGGYLSTAHTDADLDYIIQAIKDSAEELRNAGLLSIGDG
jgi:glutamate-1-semialdehyde aminotransferase